MVIKLERCYVCQKFFDVKKFKFKGPFDEKLCSKECMKEFEEDTFIREKYSFWSVTFISILIFIVGIVVGKLNECSF